MRRVYCWLCGRLTPRGIADVCMPEGDFPICHRCATRLMRLAASGQRDFSRLRFRQWAAPLDGYVFRWSGRR